MRLGARVEGFEAGVQGEGEGGGGGEEGGGQVVGEEGIW